MPTRPAIARWGAAALAVAQLGLAVPRADAAAPDVAVTAPTRVLDTRLGLGAPQGYVQPDDVVRLDLSYAVQSGTASVVLNLTAVDAREPGWARAWPCGEPVPPSSVINFVPLRNAANAVAIKLGEGGHVCLSSSAPVHLLADVQATFVGTDDFAGTSPNRITDTRQTGDPLRARVEREIPVAGAAGIPNVAAIAALNLTVPDAPADGWLVAYPCGTRTDGSTVNFKQGETVANLTFVQLAGGSVCLSSSVPTDIIVDTYGWAAASSAMHAQAPRRLLDTRNPPWPYGPAPSDSQITLHVAGRGGVPSDAKAALLTVTVADTAGDGYVTIWPCDQAYPIASTVNMWPDALRSNLALVGLAAADGTVCLQLHTNNATPISLIVDAVGWVDGGPSGRPTPPSIPPPPGPGSNPGDGGGGSGGGPGGGGPDPWTPPAPVVVGGHDDGCVFSTAAPGTSAAFCEAFDAPAANAATSRSGDLDARLWNVTRTNTFANIGQGWHNIWSDAQLTCEGASGTVRVPRDVRICDGRLVDAVTDRGGQATLSMQPLQPFDFAGRTGTIAFDVGNDSQGAHAAWPSLWISDLPVPAQHFAVPADAAHAPNSVGISFAGQCADSSGTLLGGQHPYVGVDTIAVTHNSIFSNLPFTSVSCVLKGSPSALNHVEVRVSRQRIEVWASDAGSVTVRLIAYADGAALSFTRGFVSIQDNHFDGCKFDQQCRHSFTWDNLGFDGPELPRALSFDVPDSGVAASATAVQLGYVVPATEPRAFTVHGVYQLRPATAAYLTLNWFPTDRATVPRVRLNGGAWIDTPWPFDGQVYAWRTIAIPVPRGAVRDGANTVAIMSRQPGGVVISNLALTLVGASPAR